jgi:hypothetical protein
MPECLEEIWKRSVARYESRNQADKARKWYRYHKAQAHATAFCLTPWWLGTRTRDLLCMGRGPEDDGPPVAAEVSEGGGEWLKRDWVMVSRVALLPGGG